MASQSDSQLDALLGRMQAAASPLRDTLVQIHAECLSNTAGKVADYIPELAKANPDHFAISIVSVHGQHVGVGDFDTPFTMQSVSKPFVFGLALEDHGRDAVLSRVGVQPVSEAFNTISLDESSNRPFNPMINAGAIATTDLIRGADYPDRVYRMLAMFERYIGHPVNVNSSVFASERASGHRNRAIAHLMLNFNMVEPNLEATLDLYFQQCSIMVSCRELAIMGATLANQGIQPLTGKRAIEARYVKDLLGVMHNCGMYNHSGEWSYRVGIPAKSGVGGGIVAVVPGRVAIAAYSPRLDSKGNSVRGMQAIAALADRYHLHVFEGDGNPSLILDHFQRSRGG